MSFGRRMQGKCLVGAAVLGWVAFSGLLAETASAQAPGVTVEENKQVYSEAFFGRFQPSTSEDILRRIPGVAAILDEATNAPERGFGSGGASVLLNGRRFPGKANDINKSLRRIPAENVVRVELVTGVTDDIQIQSDGLLVNIVLAPGTSLAGTGSWELNARLNDEGRIGADGQLSYNGVIGGVNYGLGIERNLWSPSTSDAGRYSDRTRDEVRLSPDGILIEDRPQTWARDHDKWIYTGSASYDWIGGARASVNGLYQTLDITERDETDFTRFDPAGNISAQALEEHQTDRAPELLEVGGELLMSPGPGDMSMLFIIRRQNDPTDDFRNIVGGGTTTEVSRRSSKVDTGEDIGRLSYVLPAFAKLSLDAGVELARNTLRQELAFFLDQDNDGMLDPVQSTNFYPEVEELRGEVFAALRGQLNDDLSIDTSLNYEYSNLTTNYPEQPERKLGFLKPRLDLRFRVSPSTQIRMLVERQVSQLDFANFVPRYNAVDDVLEPGNPGLSPEKTWKYEVGYDRRLAENNGRIELRAAFLDVTDAIDRFPFCRTPDGLREAALCADSVPNPTNQPRRYDSAFGNIDSAEKALVEAKASLRLGGIGLDDGVLTVRGQRNWTSLIDPFTGKERRVKDDRKYEFDIGFRHDLTDIKVSYGVDYRSLGGGAINSDLRFVEYYKISPLLEAFVERQFNYGLTLRFEVQNLTHSPEYKRREIFVRNALDGELALIEKYRERRDIRAAIRLRGQF